MSNSWTLGVVLVTAVISIGVYIQVSEQDVHVSVDEDPFREMTRGSIVRACADAACAGFTRNECVKLVYSLPTPAEDLSWPIRTCSRKPCAQRRECIRGD